MTARRPSLNIWRAGIIALAMVALAAPQASAQKEPEEPDGPSIVEGSRIIVINPLVEGKGEPAMSSPLVVQDLGLWDAPGVPGGPRFPGKICGWISGGLPGDEWRPCRWNWRGECVCE